MPEPPKRATTQYYRFHTWFNAFEPSDHADFFLLIGMYAPNSAQTKPVAEDWYRDITLLFTYKEMKAFMESCRTVGGKPDGKFGFGFNDESCIKQTRGDQIRGNSDFTQFLLANRLGDLQKHLGA